MRFPDDKNVVDALRIFSKDLNNHLNEVEGQFLSDVIEALKPVLPALVKRSPFSMISCGNVREGQLYLNGEGQFILIRGNMPFIHSPKSIVLDVRAAQILESIWRYVQDSQVSYEEYASGFDSADATIRKLTESIPKHSE